MCLELEFWLSWVIKVTYLCKGVYWSLSLTLIKSECSDNNDFTLSRLPFSQASKKSFSSSSAIIQIIRKYIKEISGNAWIKQFLSSGNYGQLTFGISRFINIMQIIFPTTHQESFIIHSFNYCLPISMLCATANRPIPF